MSAKPGHLGRIRIGGTILRAHRWTVNDHVEDFDVSNFDQLGFGDYIPGLEDMDVSFEAYWDPVDNPFQLPLNIVPGTVIGPVVFSIDRVANVGEDWSWKGLLVLSVNTEVGVRSATHYAVQAKYASATSQEADIAARIVNPNVTLIEGFRPLVGGDDIVTPRPATVVPRP